MILESKCIESADEFSTSTSLLSTLTRFVRPVFDESRSRSAQSVRPFVQSSSCNAGRMKMKSGDVYLESSMVSRISQRS